VLRSPICASILYHNCPPGEDWEIIKESLGPLGSDWKLGTGPVLLVKPGTWECAQGCWEHTAPIGVYRLVWLKLVFAFHQRDIRASRVGNNSGSIPIALVCFGYWCSAEETSATVNGSFLIAESILGKRSLFHCNDGGYHSWRTCAWCSARDLVCLWLTAHWPGGVMTTIVCVRTLRLCEGGWVAQCRTTGIKVGSFVESLSLYDQCDMLPVSHLQLWTESPTSVHLPDVRQSPHIAHMAGYEATWLTSTGCPTGNTFKDKSDLTTLVSEGFQWLPMATGLLFTLAHSAALYDLALTHISRLILHNPCPTDLFLQAGSGAGSHALWQLRALLKMFFFLACPHSLLYLVNPKCYFRCNITCRLL
jgi:hypothetical protein